jgi:hypothetical protein
MVSRILNASTIVALFVGLQSGSVAYAQSVSKTVAAGGLLKLGHYASESRLLAFGHAGRTAVRRAHARGRQDRENVGL